MQKRHDVACLKDIFIAAKEATSFIKGIGENNFRNDSLRKSAVIRQLEVIGEAAKRVSEEFKSKNPGIPWQEMIGMRDKLIHGYDDIDLTIVWRVTYIELPKLIKQIKPLLE
ncbi:MAG: hypothetical protein A3F16_08560 [Deltaproteobacteria bacterium RIFCSPHIGHO2_12_FULL_43_9]|nr:MAG: hypothetical protein A3F16_08560 [Deltaproteobacteria bacterium RIFCSPHIGHO2_12_FULL_43_9]